jgi:sugar phosphate isomerase/epimerase
MKYSIILGNLGNTRDRFLSDGYKDQKSTQETLREAASIEGVEGIELVGTWDITEANAKEMGSLLSEVGLSLVSIIPDHFSQRIWGKGAFTSRDPAVRRRAVEHTKEMIDVLDELGGALINLWPGQDGYDYPLQADFDEAYGQFKEGIIECARHKPYVKISLEFKPKEPRNFCYLARSADTLLMAMDTGCDNVGVTIDTGHAFVAGENVSEAVCRLQRASKLYHMHFNDNYRSWDDDMIVGSIHATEFVELLYWLDKKGYDGWCSMDQYPYREDGRAALNESVQWLRTIYDKMTSFGMERFGEIIAAGDATEMARIVRECLFS